MAMPRSYQKDIVGFRVQRHGSRTRLRRNVVYHAELIRRILMNHRERRRPTR
jgi:hypothetical protein